MNARYDIEQKAIGRIGAAIDEVIREMDSLLGPARHPVDGDAQADRRIATRMLARMIADRYVPRR